MARARSSSSGSGPDSGIGTIRFFLTLFVAALLIRSLVAPFTIPSESMLPRLLIGDYLLVAKWPYGFSRYSFPLALPLFEGRVLAMAAPKRGDVVVFKTPSDNRTDYIKRVIGLPGDTVRMRRGRLYLNGERVPRIRVADFVDRVSPNSPCRPVPGAAITAEVEDGVAVCRYPRYRETLPGGRSYDILDLGRVPQADDTQVFTVPAGHYFLMGDNRDRSADSRFPADPDAGIGFVPAENLVGRALVGIWSTDGSADWRDPRSWLRAARLDRIGEGF